MGSSGTDGSKKSIPKLRLSKCTFCSKYFRRARNKTLHENYCPANPENNLTFSKNKDATTASAPGADDGRRNEVNPEDVVASVENLEIQNRSVAFDGLANVFRIDLNRVKQSPESIFEILKAGLRKMITEILPDLLDQHQSIKIFFALFCSFHQAVDPSIISAPPPCLQLEKITIYETTSLEQLVADQFDRLIKSIDNNTTTTGEDSGEEEEEEEDITDQVTPPPTPTSV